MQNWAVIVIMVIFNFSSYSKQAPLCLRGFRNRRGHRNLRWVVEKEFQFNQKEIINVNHLWILLQQSSSWIKYLAGGQIFRVLAVEGA